MCRCIHCTCADLSTGGDTPPPPSPPPPATQRPTQRPVSPPPSPPSKNSGACRDTDGANNNCCTNTATDMKCASGFVAKAGGDNCGFLGGTSFECFIASAPSCSGECINTNTHACSAAVQFNVRHLPPAAHNIRLCILRYIITHIPRVMGWFHFPCVFPVKSGISLGSIMFGVWRILKMCTVHEGAGVLGCS